MPYLDTGRAPLNEVGQLALPDALQAFVHLRGVHLTLHHGSSLRSPARPPFRLASSPSKPPCLAQTMTLSAICRDPLSGACESKSESNLPG